MGVAETIRALLVPPRCCACGRHCEPRPAAEPGGRVLVCARCRRRLAELEPLRGAGPQGVDRAWSAAPHQGVARDLVVALKFRRLLGVAELMAARIALGAPATLLGGGAIVPVPSARLRSLARGFDPAAEIAAALASQTSLPLRDRCLRRRDGRRQVGRRRSERIGRPPRVEARGPVPRSVVLVDDVLTTGATVAACARALRSAGAVRVVAVTFSRRP